MNPGYEVHGKTFKTVNGLANFLTKRHRATEMSMIGADRLLRLYRDRKIICAVYQATVPEVGKATLLTLVAFEPAADRVKS